MKLIETAYIDMKERVQAEVPRPSRLPVEMGKALTMRRSQRHDRPRFSQNERCSTP
jgi:hypothetical protein